MPIELTCPCGRRLRVGDEHAGEQGRCPSCGGLLRIPERDAAVPTVAADEGGMDGLFGAGFIDTLATPTAKSPAEAEGGPETRLTAAGCVLALVSVAAIFAVAIPIVRWRDPATGQPLPRTIAILSPVLLGAAVNGIGMLFLRVIGVRVWVKKEE